MHSSVSAQHASPCKSMKDDVSCVSQLFDMQTVFLCKSGPRQALDNTGSGSAAFSEAQVCQEERKGRKEGGRKGVGGGTKNKYKYDKQLIWTRGLFKR